MPEINGLSFLNGNKDNLSITSSNAKVNKPENEVILSFKKEKEFTLSEPENINEPIDTELNSVNDIDAVKLSSENPTNPKITNDNSAETIKSEDIPQTETTAETFRVEDTENPFANASTEQINEKVDDLVRRNQDGEERSVEEQQELDKENRRYTYWIARDENLNDEQRTDLQGRLNKTSKAAQEQTVENQKNHLYSKTAQRGIWQKTPNSEILAENIGHLDDDIETSVRDFYLDNAQNTKNDSVLKAIARGISLYSEDNQASTYEKVYQASKIFDTKIQEEIRNTLTEQIKDCSPQAQNEIVEKALLSGDKEFTQKTVEAFCNNKKIPDDLKQETLQKVITALANPMSVGETDNLRFADDRISINELQNMTPAEKSAYFLKLYKQASIGQKVEMILSNEISPITRKQILSSLSPSEQKKYYEQMAKYHTEFFKNYVAGDAQIAKHIISMQDLNFNAKRITIQIISDKAKADPQFKNILTELNKTNYTSDDLHRLNKARGLLLNC